MFKTAAVVMQFGIIGVTFVLVLDKLYLTCLFKRSL